MSAPDSGARAPETRAEAPGSAGHVEHRLWGGVFEEAAPAGVALPRARRAPWRGCCRRRPPPRGRRRWGLYTIHDRIPTGPGLASEAARRPRHGPSAHLAPARGPALVDRARAPPRVGPCIDHVTGREEPHMEFDGSTTLGRTGRGSRTIRPAPACWAARRGRSTCGSGWRPGRTAGGAARRRSAGRLGTHARALPANELNSTSTATPRNASRWGSRVLAASSSVPSCCRGSPRARARGRGPGDGGLRGALGAARGVARAPLVRPAPFWAAVLPGAPRRALVGEVDLAVEVRERWFRTGPEDLSSSATTAPRGSSRTRLADATPPMTPTRGALCASSGTASTRPISRLDAWAARIAAWAGQGRSDVRLRAPAGRGPDHRPRGTSAALVREASRSSAPGASEGHAPPGKCWTSSTIALPDISVREDRRPRSAASGHDLLAIGANRAAGAVLTRS